MRTLLENITFIKGVEYLIIVAFCFGFIALWLLIHTEKKQTKILLSITILAILFAGGAVALNKYLDPENLDIIPNNQNNNITHINPDYFKINYGPAVEFHDTMGDKVSCSTCHHNSKEVRACKECHEEPFNSSEPNKPGLKAAYHQRCISCHQNKFDGPDSCIHCHTGKDVQISVAIPHKLTWEHCDRCHTDNKESKIVYHDNCITCHTKNSTGATQLPHSHEGRDSKTCQGCHRPVS